MSNRKSRKENRPPAGRSRRNWLVVTVILGLVCVVGTSILAQVSYRKKDKSLGQISVMNLSPSKEYIYAGGRLVATEESAPGCDTSNADADSDGIPNLVEGVEGTNPCVKDNDIFSNARFFAMQQYRDFLGREGDSGGITFWTNVLNAGSATRAQVIDSFFSSSEFQGSTAPVTRLYFAYFLRIPDYTGLEFWVNQYRQGITLDSISQAFAQSPEFIARYGSLSNQDFVTLVYQNVLGRSPDPGGKSYWVYQLDNGVLTRGQVMVGFSESNEYKGTSFNKVYVTMIYVGMLRRSPDQSGFDYWVNQLNNGASRLGLIQGFLTSPEYHNRFLP